MFDLEVAGHEVAFDHEWHEPKTPVRAVVTRFWCQPAPLVIGAFFEDTAHDNPVRTAGTTSTRVRAAGEMAGPASTATCGSGRTMTLAASPR